MGFMDLFCYLYESRLSDLFTDLRYKLLISSTPVSSVDETGVTIWYQSGVLSRLRPGTAIYGTRISTVFNVSE